MKNIVYILFFFSIKLIGQQTLNDFLTPSDSLNLNRKNTVIYSEIAVGAISLIGLNQIWYKDYPKSSFHFKNDNAHWNQMDKAGHVFSSYHIGRFGAELLDWSGENKKNQLVYGATLGFAFLTAVEIFDGYSQEWGASLGDVVANAAGSGLYIAQELIWEEQRIIPKFSFHHTPYAAARPNVLGETRMQQILKDYNGQTYWLSCNLKSFLKNDKIPNWLNIAFGYGAEGMITASDQLINTIFLDEKSRIRQYYISLDVDLSKIKTNSAVLRTIFSVFNTVKIPAPTFYFDSKSRSNWHLFYF